MTTTSRPPLQISTILAYSGGFKEAARSVAEMEKAGLDLVWVAEVYGFDSPSLMGYLAALTERVQIGSGIMNIYSRTPSLIAMTAAGIDALSDGRFHLGLGASGPQVIEGFYGVPYTNPLGRTREIVDICRDVWKREAPLVHQGKNFTLPLPSDQGTGLGKALKMLTHPVRSRDPHLDRVTRREERRDDRRDRRRVAPGLLHPRARERRLGRLARGRSREARSRRSVS